MFNWFKKTETNSKKIDESNRICPKCIEKMDKVVKGTIIIDVCPKCKGIWLDDKEIDKLIEFVKHQQKETNTQTSTQQSVTVNKTNESKEVKETNSDKKTSTVKKNGKK